MNILRYIKDYLIIKKSGLFDAKYYLFKYEDVRKVDINPLWHFVRYGYREGRNPNPNLHIKSLYQKFPELIKKDTNPLVFMIQSKKSKIKYCKIENNYVNNLQKTPLVSIIILTRDGLEYMKVLLSAIKENTLYSNYEIIVVDNASNDDTLVYLNQMKKELPLTIIENAKNESFSKANNDATKLAKGELFLFLNNDTEPLKGWLCELVKEYLNNPKLGSAGSKLIYPFKERFVDSCKLQHTGIAFRYEGEFYRPYNMGNGADIQDFSTKEKRSAVTAACVLVPKKIFEEVNGFDEKFIYGYEDVDLGLKILSKGYENIYVPTSKLYHYEFGTQNKDKNKDISKRRLNNSKHFKSKWHTYLKKHYWFDKLNNGKLFTDTLHIGIIVSNKGDNVSEGDYFTAMELGEEMKKLGWKVSYISQKHNEWYNFNDDIDVLLVLLDKYDLNKLPKYNKKIITIAWPRNWFDRWVKNPCFEQYDIVLASGKTACKYIESNSNQQAILFPIATNPNRFKAQVDEKYECDYCFTGSYWNDKREIINFLNPSKIKFKFNIYGKNWNKISKFAPFNRGFIKYTDIPKVYANTKLVIDDANRVTKPYGSVNSRVFDALGAGKLVLTNGKLGSQELFDNEVPVFETEKKLTELIEFYLSNPNKRIEKVNKLQKFVLENHTYAHRAKFLKKILEEKFLKKSIVIKIPAPRWAVVDEWGDYHFAKAMQKQFVKLGYDVLLQTLEEWNDKKDVDFDNVLVLRGLSKYIPKDYHFNIMWNISHPDKIDINEYNLYDFSYISSIKWSNHLKGKVKNIDNLLQCTDPEVFKNIEVEENIDILFIGNSRKVYRKVIKDLLPIKYTVEIYGTNWEKFVDKKYIKAQNIKNNELYKYYNRAKIILNDHWEDMKEKGFISNRIFDVSACGKFIITDEVETLDDIFRGSIVTFKNKKDLHQKIEFYIHNEEKRKSLAKEAQQIVLKNHTFENRVKKIDNMLNKKVYWWNN